MDSRKVSSLSMLSDTSTEPQTGRTINLVIENIGEISVSEATGPKSLNASGVFIAVLSGESRALVAELRLRADTSDCLATRSALLELPGCRAEEKRYLDLALVVTTCSNQEVWLLLLGERKNKERFVAVVEVVTANQALSLGREMAVYDKASMLGKGLTHIAATPGPNIQPGEADIFTCGNILRKLRMEEGGMVVKPTTGRVPVPPECQDGTISLCVATSPNKKGFSVITSFRTKSAGKNKFQVNWFQGRNDDLSAPAGKSSLKLSEDQEPAVILADPRDARAIYVVCNNTKERTAGLYKLIRGRKLEDPISTFSFLVTEACFVCGTDKNLFLLLLDSSAASLKVFHVTKTEGYRGMAGTWSACPDLQAVQPSFQAVSCSQHRWQLSASLADSFLSARCPYQLGLATLLTPHHEIAVEPESGAQYRLRALGADQNNDAILIILDDLERCFESEEEPLSGMTLKICLNCGPSRDGLSQLSAWLMAGRLAAVELQCGRLESDCVMDSDRLAVSALSPDTLR